jgi:hypothetical protein
LFSNGPGCRCVTATATSLGEVDLRGVAAVARDDVWAVGSGGAIFRFDGVAWSPAVSPTTRNLNGVWAAKNGEAWAVGDAGTILRFDGTAWAVVPQSAIVADLCGVSAGVIVGKGGTILMPEVPEGDTWVVAPSGTSEDLLTVTVDEERSRFWAAGARGTVLERGPRTGNAWASLVSETEATLHAVRQRVVGSAVIAGDDGTLCTAMFGSIRCERPLPGRALYGLAGGLEEEYWYNEAWAVGDAGVLVYGRNVVAPLPPATFDWRPVETGLQGALRGAASDGEGGFWAVGDGGMVVHVRIDDP